jgi:hypothetical protein
MHALQGFDPQLEIAVGNFLRQNTLNSLPKHLFPLVQSRKNNQLKRIETAEIISARFFKGKA